jgi:hypothetical protein
MEKYALTSLPCRVCFCFVVDLTRKKHAAEELLTLTMKITVNVSDGAFVKLSSALTFRRFFFVNFFRRFSLKLQFSFQFFCFNVAWSEYLHSFNLTD